MLESTTTTIGAATRITFSMEDIVPVEPATTVTLTLNGEDIVIGDTITTFVSSSDMNYNILANEAMASSANGVRVIIDNPIINLIQVENGRTLTFAGTSYTDIGTVPFSNDAARVSLRAGSQIITDDLTPTILNRLKVKNYKAIKSSDEKKVVWDGAEVLCIYDTKSSYIDTMFIKDIRFKLCCPKNDFNYNYFDHNDNGGEGLGILIGDFHHSLIEVC